MEEFRYIPPVLNFEQRMQKLAYKYIESVADFYGGEWPSWVSVPEPVFSALQKDTVKPQITGIHYMLSRKFDFGWLVMPEQQGAVDFFLTPVQIFEKYNRMRAFYSTAFRDELEQKLKELKQ